MARVLVVDDEENIRLVLRTVLTKQGFEVEIAESAESALAISDVYNPHFVLADVRMRGMSGLELTSELRTRGQNAVVIVMSAYGSVELALAAMQQGAYDYISKPFKQDEVILALRKAQERESLRTENRVLRAELSKAQPPVAILGKSPPVEQLRKLIERAAGFTTTVLIQGESGTGKELVARALHSEGPRRSRPFVAVNCGAIPEALLESELFGHRRGAFTDASSDKQGLFEAADTGTIFLDEIAELPRPLQVKLLRVLQESTIRRVGDTKDRRVDVRILAASMKNLRDEVAAGNFREDLYFRLNVLTLEVPSLRARPSDIIDLAKIFIQRNNARFGLAIEGLDAAAEKCLLEYSWPGNIRELENCIERAMVLCESTIISDSDLPDFVLRGSADLEVAAITSGSDLSVKKATRAIEESLIRKALEQTKGNRTAAARLLELSHRALLYKLKEYGVK